MRIRVRPNRSTAWGLCAALAVAFAGLLIANIDGAIFTTTQGGTTVNGNIYPSKADVYLNGGPQNENANGLPDGTYYFQVTDPPGATLLSTDDITCRQLVVSAGRVVGVPAGFPPASCAAGVFHAVGSFNAANGTTSVQLAPFDDTPNNGDEYKVWLTAVTAYDPASCSGGNGSKDGFGFCDSESKTDNFKVRANSAYVTVCKFNDRNDNGVRDDGEPLIPHWPITATGVDNAPVTVQTNDNGCVTFVNSSGTDSNVTLTEGTVGFGWTQTAPGDATYGAFTATGGVISVTLHANDNLTAPDFGNFNPYCTDGCPIDRLVVTKTAQPRLTRTFKWNIDKSVDKTEIDIASGGGATFNYTVSVTHDSGTDSGWTVTGTIRVANPGAVAINNVDVTDVVDNGGTCLVTGGTGVTIPANSHVDLNYTCTYDNLPPAGTNTATASFGPSSGTAAVDFGGAEITVVDGSVKVTDSLGSDLGTVLSGDASPTDFHYSHTFTGDPAGTCTGHDNKATFVTNTTGTTLSDSAAVRVCVGANLTVSKTANPSFKRTYNWSIRKSVDKTLVEQVGGQATFNYTVDAAETGFTDSEWKVTGAITVSNPNDWESIVAGITDIVDNGGLCVVTGGASALVPAAGSITLPYTCTYASAPSSASGSNTATAAWDSEASRTPGNSASGGAGFVFSTPTTTVNKSITVTDTFNGSTTTLGYLTATDTAPYTTRQYTYSRTIANTTGGSCKTYDNTAALTQTGQSASRTVNICNPATGALTIGFWQNKNGQSIITGGASVSGVCKSGTWLRRFAPFQDLSATASCSAVGTYVTNIIKAANASGAAMNAMLKAQMLATALDVYFSDAALGGKKISAPAAIGGEKIDLTNVCKMIDNTTTGTATCSGTMANASSAFGGATAQTVSQILAYAASQSNVGGSIWYGQVKATQELAKNTFDAVNNQVANIAP